MNGADDFDADDYKEMLAHAMIGREVMWLVRKSGLMVPRQKPGRKPAPPVVAKAQVAKAKPAPARQAEAEDEE